MAHHRRGLRRLLKNDTLLNNIESDFETAEGLTDARKTMLRYAIKLTRTPQKMVQQDVINLKQAGFSDLDILHIAEVAGYYAYVNRIADGLGVELESD